MRFPLNTARFVPNILISFWISMINILKSWRVLKINFVKLILKGRKNILRGLCYDSSKFLSQVLSKNLWLWVVKCTQGRLFESVFDAFYLWFYQGSQRREGFSIKVKSTKCCLHYITLKFALGRCSLTWANL